MSLFKFGGANVSGPDTFEIKYPERILLSQDMISVCVFLWPV